MGGPGVESLALKIVHIFLKFRTKKFLKSYNCVYQEIESISQTHFF